MALGISTEFLSTSSVVVVEIPGTTLSLTSVSAKLLSLTAQVRFSSLHAVDSEWSEVLLAVKFVAGRQFVLSCESLSQVLVTGRRMYDDVWDARSFGRL